MVNLRLSFFEVFNVNFSEPAVAKNKHVLPENIVLMNSKIFLNSKF